MKFQEERKKQIYKQAYKSKLKQTSKTVRLAKFKMITDSTAKMT